MLLGCYTNAVQVDYCKPHCGAVEYNKNIMTGQINQYYVDHKHCGLHSPSVCLSSAKDSLGHQERLLKAALPLESTFFCRLLRLMVTDEFIRDISTWHLQPSERQQQGTSEDLISDSFTVMTVHGLAVN